LKDSFGGSKCNLKLYVDQESEFERKRDGKTRMKLFTEPHSYPYSFGKQLSEVEIVTLDPTNDDEVTNNSADLFSGPLEFFNQMEQCQRLLSNRYQSNFKPGLRFKLPKGDQMGIYTP
jgi:hypothetical protein